MDQEDTPNNDSSTTTAEPVRSRWTPKPEQIQILESIFNNGTVNPTKDETIKIRKILEQYGAVGDANVFYWFQNRRSRSRRRQRQLQAAAAAASASSGTVYDSSSSCSPTASGGCVFPYSFCSSPVTSSSSSSMGNSGRIVGDEGGGSTISFGDDLFSISQQMGPQCLECSSQAQMHNPYMCYTDATSSQLPYPSGTITVFINGIPSEVPRGPFDMRAMFGQDMMLVHTSGEILPSNEFGFLLQSLQMGECYFLVSRPT
uniref:WUS1 n=1 Tax=Hemerocallis middendorffii TaxID=213589 RepID=A0A9E7LUU8_9ASPA|nr:WUSCHEL-related homeobox 11-like protein [Hemerocallis middendorffii]